MTALARTFAIALCLMLIPAATGWAAGKRKHARGKPPAHSVERGRAKPPVHSAPAPSESTAEPSPAKSGPVPQEARPSETRTTARESVRQESRIEFDERMLRGQSAAGVIYLFQRTPSDWKSTVEVPDSFRQRTVEVVTPVEERK